MSDIKCNCPGNPNSHAKDCPVYMQEEITRLQAENEALKAANRDLQDWFDDARTTAEKAQARVAELEATLYHGNLEREKSQKVMILRKQAEAVDASGSLFARWGGSIITAWHGCAILEQEAKRLRQQAGELEAEKAGGEQCR